MFRWAIFAALAAFWSSAATAQSEYCARVLKPECLQKLGAGALPATDDCSSQLRAYRECLAAWIIANESVAVNEKIQFFTSLDALNSSVEYIEQQVGVARFVRGDIREYHIDDCIVEVTISDKGAATTVGFEDVRKCGVDLTFIFDIYRWDATGEVRTFGDLLAVMNSGAHHGPLKIYGCLSLCGNAVPAQIGLFHEGAHADNWLNFSMTTPQGLDIYDQSQDFLRRLRADHPKEQNTMLEDICKIRLARYFRDAFGDVEIVGVSFGYGSPPLLYGSQAERRCGDL